MKHSPFCSLYLCDFSPTFNQNYINRNLLFHCCEIHVKKNYQPNPIYFLYNHNFSPGFDKINVCVYSQARHQDLGMGGGGIFERVRKVQTTLTRIFIVLESESHDLSENCENLGNSIVFPARKQVVSKEKGLHRN